MSHKILRKFFPEDLIFIILSHDIDFCDKIIYNTDIKFYHGAKEMKAQLLVSVGVYQAKFRLENFIGSNDIFMLCKEGSFVVTDNGKNYTVSAGEGFLFKKNVLYHRVIKEPARRKSK